MLKTYRYRLKPTKSQVTTLERQLDLCRFVYNDTLAYRKNAWELEQRTVKRFETQDRLPQLKLEVPELREVYSLVLQNVALRVELAFKAFFRRVKSGENPGILGSKEKAATTASRTPNLVSSWILESSICLRSEISRSSSIGRSKAKSRLAQFAECRLANGSLASRLIWARFSFLLGKTGLL